jgi:hypothetical protein
LGICEFPDAESVVAFSMKASSSGSFARFEATALLTRGRSRDEARTINECELPGAGHLGWAGQAPAPQLRPALAHPVEHAWWVGVPLRLVIAVRAKNQVPWSKRVT